MPYSRGAGGGISLCGTRITNPTAASLQMAIDSAAGGGTEKNPGVVVVCGSVVLEAKITLRSNLILVFEGGITTTLAPAAGLADDPTNYLFGAHGVIDTSVLSTTTTAIAPIGAESLDVVGAGSLAADDWVLVDATNTGSDIPNSSGVAGGVWEVVQVASVSGTTLTLAVPLREYFESGARVRALLPIENVLIGGGFLDATGGSIADGFVAEHAVNVAWEGGSARGFSRSAFEARLGSREWRVSDYRREGENNCDVMGISAHGGLIERLRYNPSGARFHANGIPRGAITMRQRCAAAVARDLQIGATCVGINLWGGLNTTISGDVYIEDCDPTERANRVGPGDLDGFNNGGVMGSAFDGGPASVGLAEFGYGWRLSNWTLGNCKTPSNPNANIYTGFWHDALESELTAHSIVNMGPGNAQKGYRFADFNGLVRGLECRGLLTPIAVANPSPGVPLQFSGLRINQQGGSGSVGSPVFFFDDYVNVVFEDTYVANFLVLRGIGGSYQSINDIRFRRLDLEGAQQFDEVAMVLNASAVNHVLGAIVELDATGGALETLVKSATAGAGAAKYLAIVKGSEDVTSTRMLVATCAPGVRSSVRCTAAAVLQGASLGHSLAGEAATLGAPVGIEVLGRAQKSKAGGAAGLVQIG